MQPMEVEAPAAAEKQWDEKAGKWSVRHPHQPQRNRLPPADPTAPPAHGATADGRWRPRSTPLRHPATAPYPTTLPLDDYHLATHHLTTHPTTNQDHGP